MAEAEAKLLVPKSILKKTKRSEEWALAKKQELDVKKKKDRENWKLIFSRALQYFTKLAFCTFSNTQSWSYGGHNLAYHDGRLYLASISRLQVPALHSPLSAASFGSKTKAASLVHLVVDSSSGGVLVLVNYESGWSISEEFLRATPPVVYSLCPKDGCNLEREQAFWQTPCM